MLITGGGALNSTKDPAGADSQMIEFSKQTNTEEKEASENIDEENETVKALTMEALLELYENDGLTAKLEEEGLEDFLAYENMKPVSVREDSLTGLYTCALVYPHGAVSSVYREGILKYLFSEL